MDELRYILLILGLILLFGIYFTGRRQRQSLNSEANSNDYDADSEELSPDAIAQINSDITIDPPESTLTANPIASAVPITAPVSETSVQQEDQDIVLPNRRQVVTPPPIENWRFRPIESGPTIPRNEIDRPAGGAQKMPQQPATKTGSTIKNSHNEGGKDRDSNKRLNLENTLLTVVNVVAYEGRSFSAVDVREVLDTLGLHYGDMRIYHYYATAPTSTASAEMLNEKQQRVFSVANIKEPGCFDINDINTYETIGLSLFMLLPGPIDGLLAFEKLINIADILAERLGGFVCDDNFNKITKQTLTHLRDAISEFTLHYHVNQA